MSYINKKYLLLFFLIFYKLSSSQNLGELDSILKISDNREKEIDSFVKMDFFKKNFKYLDSDFKINIDSITFNAAVRKYKFYTERIKNYEDSLTIVLTYELRSNHGSRIAANRITYKWKKIGYYLWLSENEAKELGLSFGFEKPYLFYEFLIDEDKRTVEKSIVFKKLEEKLIENNIDIQSIDTYKKLIHIAFKHNPDRISDMNAYFKKKSTHKH